MFLKTQIIAWRNPARRAVELYIYQGDGDKSRGIADKFELHQIEPGELVDPSLTIDEESAAELFQSLWDQGYRPRNYEGASTVETLKYHMEDMRKIAFMFLEKDGRGHEENNL